MIETVCPNCDRPRPPGVKQCLCNYTFEYDKLPAARGPRAAGAGPARGLLAAVALVAAVAAGAFFNGSVRDRSRPEVGFLLIAAGVFAVCGAIFAWGFFMSHRRARLLTLFLGATGTRFFYALLGGALAGVGVAMALL